MGIHRTLLEEGGLLMWPMLLLSIFGFIIFIERFLFLHRGQIRSDTFLAGIRTLLGKGRLVEALTVCEETPGPVASIVKAALLAHDRGEERMRAAIQAAAMVEIPSLERRVGTLAAVARVAPLIGLLGTVVGMVEAFYSISEEGAYAHMGTLSSGFASALITTAAGIAVAIMAHLAFHFLSGRVRALVHDMEYAGHDIMQFMLHGQVVNGAEAPAAAAEKD